MIEVVLVVVAIGILLALTLPGLQFVRHSADQIVTKSRLSQHAAGFSAYGSDFSGYYPFFTSPTATYSVVRCGGQGYRVGRYFDAQFYWSAVMSDYLGQPCGDPAFFPKREATPGPEQADPYFLYPASLISDPDFWNVLTRTGPNQWRAVGTHEVKFPSYKGVLVSFHPWDVAESFGSPRFVAAFADGHASDHLILDARQPYPRGEGDWRGFVFNYGLPVLHTADGVRGRDY